MERDYCGALLHAAKLGPRRGLTLSLEIWPQNRHEFRTGEGESMMVHFGGISNYEQVERAFTVLSSDQLHQLHDMRDLREPKPTRRVVELTLDRIDVPIRIVAAHVTEQGSE